MNLQILKCNAYYNETVTLPTEIKITLNFALFACLALTGFAQENAELVEDDIINLEPFVIFAGEMDVIDGITGKEYNGTNAVVWGFVDTFKKYLVRYHEKLLRFEIPSNNTAAISSFRTGTGTPNRNEEGLTTKSAKGAKAGTKGGEAPKGAN